jgi:hypothetical protein
MINGKENGAKSETILKILIRRNMPKRRAHNK